MKTNYEHYRDHDIKVGQSWIDLNHIEKHIEIIGASGHGKTTFMEQLFLGIMEEAPGGMLLIDPKGHSVDKWLGWVAEGRVKRPVWLVDTDGPVLRYNPLNVDKDPYKLATTVSGLFEALSLMQGDSSPAQHRQMRHFVGATFRALIECDLTIADAYDWLTDEGFRAKHRHKIKHYETGKEWSKSQSVNNLQSTFNWFAAFWAHDWVKAMYAGDGFSWKAVYDDQPLVLVNLAQIAGSLEYSRAIAAMLITGLLEHARHAKPAKRWYAVIDDATDFTPAHVGQVIKLGRAFELYLTLAHHENFEGGLQSAVHLGCRTKFIFGEYGQGTNYMRIPQYTCAHEFDKELVQTLRPGISPRAANPAELKQKIFSHPWYGAEAPRQEPANQDQRAKPKAAPASAPSFAIESKVNQKPYRPRPNKSRS